MTLKDEATPDQVKEAKKHATDQGGKITHEYTLIKAFAYASHDLLALARTKTNLSCQSRVSFPEDAVQTLESNEHVKLVEKDQEVRTQ